MFSSLHPLLLSVLSQPAHAYIFCGPAGEGQALAFSAALLCQRPTPAGEACGSCPACANLAAGTHPDCRVLSPGKSKYEVEAIRHLVGEASLSPISGARRVFILSQADRLNEEGANTLLKLLEEPAETTLLILTTQHPDSLLPTVLSRCQCFDLGGVVEVSLEPELLAQARALLTDLPRLRLWQVFVAGREREGDRESLSLFFQALLEILHQGLRGRIELPFAPAQLFRSASMVESALEMLDSNVNQKLLVDVIYLRLWQNCQP